MSVCGVEATGRSLSVGEKDLKPQVQVFGEQELLEHIDKGRKVWHQTWVTNRGRLLTIEGHAGREGIVMVGSYFREDGEEVRVRGTWKPVRGGVQETAAISDDDGNSWKPWFDLLFRSRGHGK